ncbi:MAG: peptidoglycan DD-metalloendopeptidase family protein [Candidatus Cloacimonetes bacterium]|nr:peptidoglycan DD-metalloendopeptidase family protein [Candidatus Cloacimonadota bacterium]
MKTKLLIIAIVLISISCSTLPKDEITEYESGLKLWQKGHYEKALPHLLKYAEIDRNYSPLYEVIGHCYYETGKIDSCLYWLKKSGLDNKRVKNLYFSIKSVQIELEKYSEHVDFLEYVHQIANKYNLDAGLLLAFMWQESGFKSDAVSMAGAVGLMQLMPSTAKALGLRIPEDNFTTSPEIYDDQIDERFNPAKNLDASANHISFLLNHYKNEESKSDLTKAMAAYLAGTGNVRDSIPPYAEHYVKKISDYYKFYRYNIKQQENANRLFYSANDTSVSKYFEQKHYNYTVKDLKAYLNQLSAGMIYQDECSPAFLNNTALAASSVDNLQLAHELFKKAMRTHSTDPLIIYNYSVFCYNHRLLKTASENFVTLLNYPEFHDVALLNLSRIKIEQEKYYAYDFLENMNRNSLYQAEYAHLRAVKHFYSENSDKSLEELKLSLHLKKNPLASADLLAVFYQKYFHRTSSIYYTDLNVYAGNHRDFIWPTDRSYISSFYGWRPDPAERIWDKRLLRMSFHSGIDIPGITGEPVYAVADGVITLSDSLRNAGEAICIKHNNGIYSVYYHLYERMVNNDDFVYQGQIIGFLGSTGFSTGPHLHFGVYNSKWQSLNPLDFLPGKKRLAYQSYQ